MCDQQLTLNNRGLYYSVGLGVPRALLAAARRSGCRNLRSPQTVKPSNRRWASRWWNAGKLDERSLERARRVGSGNRQGLARVLPKLGLVSERDLAEALARQAGVALVGERDFPALPLLDSKVSLRFLKESRVLPLAETEDGLVLAMADPFDAYAIDAMRLASGRPVEPRVAVQSELEGRRSKGSTRMATAAEAGPADDGDGDDSVEFDIEQLQDMASEAPVIRMVNRMIESAVEAGASDIHLEPRDGGLRVRISVDGALREVDSPPDRYRAAIVSRIKILARLNIAQRQLPQDGRIKMAVRGIPVDLRIATLPTVHGESVVMRILDRDSVALDFETLGITAAAIWTTGWACWSGRTGWCWSPARPAAARPPRSIPRCCTSIHPDKKVITVEDPVEYQLADIVQAEVKPQIGLDFARLLRALLRNAPDIMLVGEIRDPGNRQNRHRIRPDRPSGAVDGAHQQRRRGGSPPAGHGGGGIPARLHHQRRRRPAAGANLVHRLPRALCGDSGDDPAARPQALFRSAGDPAVPGAWLSGLRRHRLSGPNQHHGDPGGRRYAAADDPRPGRCFAPCRKRRSRTACGCCSTTAWKRRWPA